MREVVKVNAAEENGTLGLSVGSALRAELAVRRSLEVVQSIDAATSEGLFRVPFPFQQHTKSSSFDFGASPEARPLPRNVVRGITALQQALAPEREAIRSGALRGPAFLEYATNLIEESAKLRDNTLADLVVDLLLEIRKPVETEPGLPGAHHFTPTPVKLVPKLIKEGDISAADRICDLGCGNNRLLALLHLATGCSGKGIEILPKLAAQGRIMLERNNIPAVTLEHGNAVRADLRDVDVVVMYAPFFSSMYREAVHQLERRASKGPLRVVVHGPTERYLEESGSFICRDPYQGVRRFDALHTASWGERS